MKKSFLKTSLVLALTTLLALPSFTNAQSNIMYGSSRNPLMNNYNPAFFPSRSKVFVAFPSFNFDFGSPLAYSSIFKYDAETDKTAINLNSILDTLATDKLRFGTNIHTFGFGINFDKFFITLSSQAKVSLGAGVPSGLVQFLNEGNYNHTGDDVIELVNGSFANAIVYGEGALGFGYRITDRLSVGGKVKLLMGALDLSDAGSSLTLRTAPDYSSMTATLNMNMNLSSCIDIHTDTLQDGSTKVTTSFNKIYTKNIGVNFDLGARYATDLFEVSASILDFGPGIHWKEGHHKIVSANEKNSFTFTGMDMSEYMHGGQIDTGFANMLIDSLKTMTDVKIVDGGEDYWTTIPTKVNLGGMFHINNTFSAGLLFHGEFERGLVKVDDVFKTKTTGFYSRTALMARMNLKDWFELVVAASVLQNKHNWDWFNPGVGVTFTPFKTVQFYYFLDFISDFYLVDAKQVNMTFGLNLLIGRGNNK